MSKRLAALMFIAVLLLSVPLYAAETFVEEATSAPVPQAYLDYLKEREHRASGNDTRPDKSGEVEEEGEPFYGLAPMPIDLSHLENNPPKFEPEYAEGDTKPVKWDDTSDLPSTYDLREHNAVSAVKNQSPFETCWAHAAIGAVESNFMKNGGSMLDLSEMHLAWFVYKDPVEGKYFTPFTPYDQVESDKDPVLDQGGNPVQSIAFFSRMDGPVYEETLPYPAKEVTWQEKSGNHTYTYTQIKDTGERPAEGTATEAYGSPVLRLKDASFYSNYDDISVTNEMRKRLIRDRGAIQISYYAGAGANTAEGTSVTAYFNNSQGTKTNHSVLLVGWDDNFSVENFDENMRPQNNGAWLVKNSWGTDWGSEGYFWMSYEQYIQYGVAYTVSYDAEPVKYYGYDDLGWCGVRSYKWAANVFKTGDKAEILKEVGFYTTDNNASYEVYVFDIGETALTNPIPDDVTEFDSHLAVSGKEDCAGYHTAALASPVTIPANHYFSVMTKMVSTDEAPYNWPTAVESSNNIRQNLVVNEGESYFCSRLKYSDGTEALPLGNARQYWTDGVSNNINACIKAFTIEATETPVTSGLEITSSVFPDATFMSYVKKFDLNNDGYLSTTEIASIVVIDLTGLDISDLTGIDNFTSLTYLKIKGTNITSLDITNLPKLSVQDIEYDYGVVITDNNTGGSDLPMFAFNSLLLSGQIGVNFYMYLPDSTDCWMSFDINGERLCAPQPVDPEITYTVGGVIYYGFRCYVNALQMADTINVTLTTKDGLTLTKKYSVNRYLNADFSTQSQATQDLVSAMKDYGHYAQIWLAETNGLTLGVDHTAMDKGRAKDYTAAEMLEVSRDVRENYALVNNNSEGSGISNISYSLNLDTSTEINLYMKASADYNGSVSAYLDSSDRNTADLIQSGNYAGWYRLQIDNIPAHELSKKHIVRIKAAKEFTLELSALSYVNTILRDYADKENDCNAVTALYEYSKATAAYRKEKGYAD